MTLHRRNRGFTLVELLVVIAIIGVLVALLLPAVQAAREAARRSQCGNNIRQLAIALHNYHDTHKYFPPAGLGLASCRNAGGEPIGLNASGWTMALPFFEQGPLHAQYNFNEAASVYVGTGNSTSIVRGDPAINGNGLVVATRLSIFNCPSDNGNPFLRQGPDGASHYIIKAGSNLNGAKTNYDFATNGPTECSQRWDVYQIRHRTDANAHRRLFGNLSYSRIDDAKDGTSNTIMLCETTFEVWDGRAPAWGYRGWVQVGIDPIGKNNPRGINIWPCCSWQSPPWTSAPIPGQTGKLGEWGSAGSFHPGGAQFAMTDGSVRYIAQTIPLATLQALASYAAGEVTSN
ncbi:MAG: DUF1559 domain-containing protein [Pirellulaceae bacterium]